ncbi:MAG: PIN domain-containing protein, partial [Bryobacterales bacterium]|nr:PIN domain-containing protein [Bryobacterales bacterium]
MGDHRIQTLRRFLQPFTVVPSSPDRSRQWAQVMVAAQAASRRIGSADAWIAATARLHDAQPLTNNRNTTSVDRLEAALSRPIAA